MSNFQISSKNYPIGIGDSERCIEIPWALSQYSNESFVLDIGYANAEERYISQLLSLNIKNLYGIDLIEKKINGIFSIVADIRKTKLPNDFFDLIFCISVIEHIGRNNSIYTINDVYDSIGDYKALQEIYRILKVNGKLILTIPFGKYFDYGWFIQYDKNTIEALIKSVPFDIKKRDFFLYNKGWYPCNEDDLINVKYYDNSAVAAAGLLCILLEKKCEIKKTRFVSKIKNTLLWMNYLLKYEMKRLTLKKL